MKKLIASLMVLSLLLTMLVGCGSSETETTTAEPETTTVATEETTEATEETTEATEETTEATEETTEATEATEETEVDSEAVGMKGITEGNVYTSPKAGFTLSLDENWYLYSEADLATMLGLTSDTFTDEDVKTVADSLSAAMVYYSMDLTTGNNININWDQMPSALTADEYVDMAIPGLEAPLAAAGFTNLSFEKVTIDFMGQSIPAISLYGEVSEVPLYELIFPVICDSYVCTITLCTALTNDCVSLLANFTPAN